MSTKSSASIDSEKMSSESNYLWKLLENRDQSLEAAHRIIQEQQQTINHLKGRLSHETDTEAGNRLILPDNEQQGILDLQEYLNTLKEQLKEQEKAYTSLLNELHIVNSQLRQKNAGLNQVNRGQNQTINQLRQQLQKKNLRLQRKNKQLRLLRKRLRRDIRLLEQEIERLKVGRVALKQAISSLLRRLGWKSHPQNLVSKPAASSSTLTSSAPQPTISPDHTISSQQNFAQKVASTPIAEALPNNHLTQERMESDSIETFILLKGITEREYPDINTVAFDFFSHLVSNSQNILCLHPTKKLASLAQAFACRGVPVTCVGCAENLVPSLEAAKVAVFRESLGNWMIKKQRSSLTDFDVILLNGHSPGRELRFLRYRLAPSTKLVIHDYDWKPESVEYQPNSQDLTAVLDLGISTAVYKNFLLYNAPSPCLVDPLYPLPDISQHQQWPWNYPIRRGSTTFPDGKTLPKISIITVTFNQGKYLEETIRSVLMQGYPNLEYIVIDGCSTDNTGAILERYRNELTHCIVEPDDGQSNALNKGFSLATGEIFAWLNSDDCYLPQTLFRIAAAFEQFQGIDMVVGGCQLRHDFSPAPFKTHHSQFPLGEPLPLPLERLLDLENCWKQGEFFYQPEVFWTRELWERSGAHVNEQLFYSMDYELWLRMAQQQAQVLHIPDPLALYRMHEAQKTYGDELPYFPELEQVAEQFRR